MYVSETWNTVSTPTKAALSSTLSNPRYLTKIIFTIKFNILKKTGDQPLCSFILCCHAELTGKREEAEICFSEVLLPMEVNGKKP
jgi:hypothetical protein